MSARTGKVEVFQKTRITNGKTRNPSRLGKKTFFEVFFLKVMQKDLQKHDF